MPIPEIINVPGLPPVNPSYSQVTRVGDLLLVAGQIGVDPATGKLVSGGIVEETRRALENMRMILEAAGSSISKVAKTTLYMTDMGEWGPMNEVYTACFQGHPPAKTTVGVTRLALGARIEIEAIAGA